MFQISNLGFSVALFTGPPAPTKKTSKHTLSKTFKFSFGDCVDFEAGLAFRSRFICEHATGGPLLRYSPRYRLDDKVHTRRFFSFVSIFEISSREWSDFEGSHYFQVKTPFFGWFCQSRYLCEHATDQSLVSAGHGQV